MHYSLVSSPFLGFDLVRLPAGDSAAEVLLRALDSGPREIEVLAERHDPATRASAWDAVRTATDAVPQIGDVLHQVAAVADVPVAAYQVSGEYSMIEAAAEHGWLDRDRMVLETLTAIRRAGAQVVLTYYAQHAARLLTG